MVTREVAADPGARIRQMVEPEPCTDGDVALGWRRDSDAMRDLRDRLDVELRGSDDLLAGVDDAQRPRDVADVGLDAVEGVGLLEDDDRDAGVADLLEDLGRAGVRLQATLCALELLLPVAPSL